ncbi:stalk domain-containing protein [Paenibacillus phyllosphaerae]|nr:stalk domain-containing protein [Paenibacillus phyllosphaerae]
MKRFLGRKTLLAAALAVVMIIAAGCQAVGGLDLNQMLKQSLKVTSYEGSQTLELQLLTDEQAIAAMDEEEAKLLKLFSNVKLSLTDLKVADEEHMSLKGKLELTDRSIGFAATVNKNKVTFELDGINKVFDLNLDRLGMPLDSSLLAVPEDFESAEDAAEAAATEESAMAALEQLTDLISGFVIDHLPNPSGISVQPAEVTVGGQSINAMHVSASLSGEQIYEWLLAFMDALSQDKEGLKTLLHSIVDLLESQESAVGGESLEELFGSTTEEARAEIDEAVNDMVDSIAEMKEELTQAKTEDPETFQAIFNANTSVKADLYVDGKLDIRKSVVQASFVAGEELVEEEVMPFNGFTVTSTTEMSKVNESITPDVIYPRPFETIKDYQFERMQQHQFLKQIDPGSDLYKLLHDDLGVFKQQVMLFPDYDEAYAPIETPEHITLIPLRFVANEFGANVSGNKQQILVYDEATGKTVKFQIGGKQFDVNGEIVAASYPVTTIDGVTYVAARDFVKIFGGKVYWNYEDYEDFKYLVIERDL